MTGLVILIAVTIAFAVAQWRFSLWQVRRMLDARALPLDDPALQAMVARLGAAVGQPGLRLQLFDMPVVNGLATPDGRILLTTALYDKYRLGIIRAEEIASVVAHELGHVALGHHTRRMIDWTGQSAARVALAMLFARFLGIVGVFLANFLAALVMSRLSRRDEFEADRYATALMLKTGLGHKPQIAMFRKLETMVPGPRGAAWLASHPPVGERVAAIEANVAAWREGATAA